LPPTTLFNQQQQQQKSIQQSTTRPSTMSTSETRSVTVTSGLMMATPQGRVQVFINRRSAARALALRKDMRVSGPTLDLLEEGIASVVDGHYGTFMHYQFKIVRLVVGDSGDGGGGGDSDEGNEEAQPSPVLSSPVTRKRKKA
jgi:hypothetical protein